MATLEQIAERLGSQGNILAVSIQGPDNEPMTRGVYCVRCSDFDSTHSSESSPELIVDSIDVKSTKTDKNGRSAHLHIFDSSDTRRTPLSIVASSRRRYLITSKEGLHIARAPYTRTSDEDETDREETDKDKRSRQIINFREGLTHAFSISDGDEQQAYIRDALDDFSQATPDKRTFATLVPLSISPNNGQYLVSLFTETEVELGQRTEKRLNPVGSFYLRATTDLKSVQFTKQKKAQLIQKKTQLIFDAEYSELCPTGIPQMIESSLDSIMIAMPEGKDLKIFALEQDTYLNIRLKEPQIISFGDNQQNRIVAYDVHGRYAAAVLYDFDANQPSFTIEVREQGGSGKSKAINMNFGEISCLGHWPRSVKLVKYLGNLYCLVGCDAGMMYAFRCATSKGLDDYMHEISKKDLLGYRFLKSTTMSRSNEALSVRQISSDYDNNIWVSCYNSVFRMKPDFALNTDGEITGQILKNEMNVRKAVFPHRVMNFTIDNKSE